jgi:hypothetical protein
VSVLMEVVPRVQRQPPVREVASPALRWVAVGALRAERVWQRAAVVRWVLLRAAVARLASSPRPVDVVASQALRQATARMLAWQHLRAPEAARVVLSLEAVMPQAGSRMVARAWQRALATTALRAWRGLPVPSLA